MRGIRSCRLAAAVVGLFVVLVMIMYASPASAEEGAEGGATECAAPAVTRTGQTWRLSATGGDDTANLQCALDEAAASGRYSRIVLGPDTFRIGFVEVVGFNGSLKGASRNRTTVEVVGGLDCVAQFAARGSVDLLGFADSNVSIRGITFQGLGGSCAAPWQALPADGPFPAVERSDVEALVTLRPGLGRSCHDATGRGDLTVVDSAFVATEPDFEAPTFAPDSVQHGVVFGQDSLFGPPPDCLAPAHTGRLRVTGSTFVGLGTGVDPSNLVDSTVSVVRNDFINVDLSVFGEDDYGSRIFLRGNNIDAPTRPAPFTPTGILILNGCSGPNPRQALSSLTIQNNDILMTEDMTGLVAADCAHGDGADPTLNVRVLGNHFQSNNGFAGVDIPFGEDGRVAGNRFSGTAFGGIGLVVNNSGFDIVNNDFTDFETDGPDILLGPETTRNRVVINEGDVVDDQGTDNIIIVR